MMHVSSFADAADLWLTPVPGATDPVPFQIACATEILLCDEFFAALTMPGYPPRQRHVGIYQPWLRIAEIRGPHLSSLDAGPCNPPSSARTLLEGEARWLRDGAFELAAA